MEENIVGSIVDLTKKTIIHDVAGVLFSPSTMKVVYDERRIETLCVHTLTGFMDYIITNIDALQLKVKDHTNTIIVIKNHKEVSLFGIMSKENKFRQEYVRATLLNDFDSFKFGQYYDVENFIINMRSLFKRDVELDRIISYVSRLTANNTIETKDDGISQSAVMNKGISGALKDKETAPSIIDLVPWRTFREVDQPVSTFIFRIKQTNGVPTCALFEADGGCWRLNAIEGIKKYLQKNSIVIPIIA